MGRQPIGRWLNDQASATWRRPSNIVCMNAAIAESNLYFFPRIASILSHANGVAKFFRQ
jgi:hypothetical protein